jgi:hypothetical protein
VLAEGGLVTAADIEALALALSKAQEGAVLGAEAFQGIAESAEVPKDLRAKAERLYFEGLDLSRALTAEHRHVREQGAGCQDARPRPLGNPLPPPPPPGAMAPSCVVCGGAGTVASDDPFMMMAAVPCGCCEGRVRR